MRTHTPVDGEEYVVFYRLTCILSSRLLDIASQFGQPATGSPERFLL